MTIVLGILGSPREKGNTEILLNAALKCSEDTGASTEMLRASDLEISGCNECEDCYETGECSIDDDMAVVYDSLERADKILVASPIFFMGLPSQLKAIIDRCQCYWALRYILKEAFPARNQLKRYGAFIGVGGTSGEKLFDGTILTLKYFFDAIAAEPLANDYLLVRGIDAKGSVLDKKDLLAAACELGRALAIKS